MVSLLSRSRDSDFETIISSSDLDDCSLPCETAVMEKLHFMVTSTGLALQLFLVPILSQPNLFYNNTQVKSSQVKVYIRPDLLSTVCLKELL